jgi:hypothetical protein
MFVMWYVAAAARVRELLQPDRRDRGEGPVPYIIMVALIAAVAVFVGGALLIIATNWLGDVPQGAP